MPELEPESSSSPHAAIFAHITSRLRVIFFYGVFIGTVGSLLASWGWPFELFIHFTPQLAVGALLASILYGVQRRWRHVVAALAIALWHIIATVPLYLPDDGVWIGAHEVPAEQRLRIALLNVEYNNEDHARVLEQLRSADADVIAVVEVGARWLQVLREGLGDTHPHVEAHPRSDRFGLVLLSRRPLTPHRLIVSDSITTLVSSVQVAQEEVTIALVHPPPPITPRLHNRRDAVIDAIIARRPAWGRSVIVLGDFNATSWSPALQRLMERARLRDSRGGRGLFGSWPSRLAVLGIAIDHVFLSENISVISREVGPHVGSDHRPVLIEVGLKE